MASRRWRPVDGVASMASRGQAGVASTASRGHAVAAARRVEGKQRTLKDGLLLLLPPLDHLLPFKSGLVVPRRRGARHVEQARALRRPFGVAHLLGLVVSCRLGSFRDVASEITEVARGRRGLRFFREP